MSDSRHPPPPDLREGVRAGILSALAHDMDLRGGRTAGRLLLAGLVGVVGAVGAMLIVSNHGFDHHPYWHEMVFSAIWAGALVVSVALVLLQVRTPRLPIARAATVGLVGLGIAGVCSLLCPDPHVVEWWVATRPGAALVDGVSLWASMLCFGFVTIFVIALVSAALLLGEQEPHGRLIAASFIAVLLLPGIVLETAGLPLSVFAAWIGGSAAGAYGGVASAGWLRAILLRG